MFVKVQVQNPMRSLRKLVLQESAIIELSLDGAIHQPLSQIVDFWGVILEDAII